MNRATETLADAIRSVLGLAPHDRRALSLREIESALDESLFPPGSGGPSSAVLEQIRASRRRC